MRRSASETIRNLEMRVARLEKKASIPKELKDEMKDWYKKIKKYLTDDNLRGARDIRTQVISGTEEYYRATMFFVGLKITIEYQKSDRPGRWIFSYHIKKDNKSKYIVNKNINEAVKMFLDFTEEFRWDGRKDLAPAQSEQRLMTPQIKQEIADKFQRVIKYFNGDKITIIENTIEAYTGETRYEEEFDGDGAGEPIERAFERALKPYDKYIETISVDWYGNWEWFVTVYLKE